MIIEVIYIAMLLVAGVMSNGRLLDPPGRSSIWRFPDDPAIKPYLSMVEENPKDDELYCGGLEHLEEMEGKCGVCGDAWDDVRENEAGGKYAKGIIVRQYEPGSMIDVTVEMTLHRMGFFEFRLCEWNEPEIPAYQDCFNENLLELEDGETQYEPPATGAGPWTFNVKVKLPEGVKCTQCILQWKYQAGNLWGCETEDHCCLGCGPQEEAYGCADIAIGNSALPPPNWHEDDSPTSTTMANEVTTSSTSPGPTTTTPTITTTYSSTTTESDNHIPMCKVGISGTYKLDCTTFYVCTNTGIIYIYNCPSGTVFDEFRLLCDHPYNVPPECGFKVASYMGTDNLL